MIKAVIFDWGGVMQALPDEAYTAEWERRLALAPGALAEALWGSAWRQLEIGAITNDEYARLAADRLGFPSVEALDRFTEAFYGGVELNRAVVGVARGLRERYKIGLLTNAWPGAEETFREQFGVDAHAEFDGYVNSADVGLRKPDPAIYELMLERLGIAPQQAVFLDDSLQNVESARRLGIHAIHVTDPAAALEELASLLGHPLTT